MQQKYKVQATGRRKSAVAVVYLREGKGEIIINDRKLDEYFGRETDRMIALQALELLGMRTRYNLKVNVKGGGLTGQAGAIKHGISRALLGVDGLNRPKLKAAGFLTRDARAKERKKYGLAGARRGFQFSKR